MKSLILVLIMFLTVNAKASEYGYQVDDITCGEIDPMIVGDACVVELYWKNKSLVLIVDYDAFVETFEQSESSYDGQVMMVKMENLKKVSWQQVEVLRSALGIKKNVVIRSATIDDFSAYPMD